MKYEKIVTSENKEIHIFDNMFDLNYMQHMYAYATNSFFKITGSVSPAKETWNEWNLSCTLDEGDVVNTGFDKMAAPEYKELMGHSKINRAFILLSFDKQMSRYHADGAHFKYTVLYYANLEWDKDWSGETIFTNNDFSKIEAGVMYKPGRVIAFDPSIPHKSCPVSVNAPQIRMVYSFNYKKENFDLYDNDFNK